MASQRLTPLQMQEIIRINKVTPSKEELLESATNHKNEQIEDAVQAYVQADQRLAHTDINALLDLVFTVYKQVSLPAEGSQSPFAHHVPYKNVRRAQTDSNVSSTTAGHSDEETEISSRSAPRSTSRAQQQEPPTPQNTSKSTRDPQPSSSSVSHHADSGTSTGSQRGIKINLSSGQQNFLEEFFDQLVREYESSPTPVNPRGIGHLQNLKSPQVKSFFSIIAEKHPEIKDYLVKTGKRGDGIVKDDYLRAIQELVEKS